MTSRQLIKFVCQSGGVTDGAAAFPSKKRQRVQAQPPTVVRIRQHLRRMKKAVPAKAGTQPKQINNKTLMNIRNLLTPLIISFVAVSVIYADHDHKSGSFQGAKANTGFVTHMTVNGKSVLTLSDDFVAPQTPDPHWQIVDSQGNTYLLQKLMIKDGKMNKSIEVPNYIRDIAKVQIWCAFAEVNLGEATFERPVK